MKPGAGLCAGAKNVQLWAAVRPLKHKQAALEERLARFEKQAARLETDIQVLKDALEAAQRQGKRQPRRSPGARQRGVFTNDDR